VTDKSIATAIIILIATRLAFPNPMPEPFISEFSVCPPWIEVNSYNPGELVGDTIWTMEGMAIITSVPWPQPDPPALVLDSSNTTGFVLNPEGDSIRFSTEGYDFSSIAYGDCSGEVGAPPPGASIVWGMYVGPQGIHYIGYNFCLSPTPGRYAWNSVGGRWGDSPLIINEVAFHISWHPHSNFIELYNQGNIPISTDSLALIGRYVYRFLPNTVVNQREFLVIDENDFPPGLDLNPDSDVLYLVVDDHYDDIFSVVDQVGWSSNHGENISFMRYPDGDVDTSEWEDFQGYSDVTSYTFEDGFPTRGAPNRYLSPGFVVIGTRADSIGGGTVRLRWTDPIWEPIFDESMVLERIDRFPQDPFDGEIICYTIGQECIMYGLSPDVTHYFTVFAHGIGGVWSIPTAESQDSIFLHSVGIKETPLIAQSFQLSCHPNPFNTSTIISYRLPDASYVGLDVYDLLGKKVASLVDHVQQAGEHSMIWNARDLPTGVYFARLKSEGYSQNTKMVLLK